MAANPFADLSAPSDFGAAPPPRSAPPPSRDATTTPGRVTPEALHYHDDEQRCELCSHFGRDNQCAVLKMPVEAVGGCNSFKGGSAPGDTTDADTDTDTTGDTGDTDEDYG